MNWGLIGTAFGLGTFKFVFVHWTVYFAFQTDYPSKIFEIFVASTAGAWITMAFFYFSSGYLMKRAAEKRKRLLAEAREKGVMPKTKKIFTRTNKGIVWIKRSIGIYGVTVLAPLFLSIPIGSIVCAKFYGNLKKTFPLMLIFTGSYSALMCFLIYLTQ